MSIHLNSNADGTFHIRWTDNKINVAYSKLVKEVLAGTTSVSELYKFVNKNAPCIFREQTKDNG